MQNDDYALLIVQRLEKYFDVLKNGTYNGRTYDITAQYHARENQTVLFKENVMDYYETNEICLISFRGDPSFISTELSLLPAATVAAASPSRKHRSTTVTRVFVTDHAEKAAVRLVRRFHFSRAFRFYFWGYAESRTVLVDLSSQKVYSDFAGRQQRKIFAPVLSGCRS